VPKIDTNTHSDVVPLTVRISSRVRRS
jgi:hypothetical protein